MVRTILSSLFVFALAQLAAADEKPTGSLRHFANVIICNTSEEQSKLWTARARSAEAYAKAYQDQQGCVALFQLEARPVGLVATFDFVEDGAPRSAAVFEIELKDGGHAFISWVSPVAQSAKL